MLSALLVASLSFLPISFAFSFSAGAATECDSLSISWSGGTPPLSLHIVPVFGVPRNISVPASGSNNGQGSFSLPQFPLGQGERFMLSMSDATGFGTGGTTDVQTVGASKGGRCDTVGPDLGFSFQLNSALTQCRPYVFSGFAGAVQPLTIIGLIPSGTSFVLNPPPGALQFSWTANVEQGTSIVFMMVDAFGRQGGSSDVRTVASSDDRSCLNGLSPSSTSAPSTTQTTQSPPKKTGSDSTSAAPSATNSSADSSSGGTSVGAIAGTVIGALLFLAAVITLGLFFLRRRKDAQKPSSFSWQPRPTGTDLQHEPYSASHPYSLSSSAAAAYAASPTPFTPQTYNPQAFDPNMYGHTYQQSAYAQSSYAPSTHNHTPSNGAYDGYSGSMLPYDTNPFQDTPQQQYPPANQPYHSAYQLPSASAYALPNPVDPFSPPMSSRGQPLPPFQPSDDPFASAENSTTSESMTSAQQRKAAMAGVHGYKPSRILVHTDAEDILPPPNAEGVVELPPQYTERRGLTVVNQSPPSPTTGQFPPTQSRPS